VEERLQKVLARAGVASRREAEKLIAEGRVSVNGRTIREFGVKVDPRVDEIRVDTIAIRRQAAEGTKDRVHLLLNKPRGVLCTVKDTHGRPTVVDLVPPHPGRRLYPVGRLDEDSEGLVLMTNDGELTAKLTHPRYGVPKVYDVRVKGKMTKDHAYQYEQGVWLSEGKTGKSRVQILRAGFEVSHVSVTLREGRNREIRRAFEKLGFPVLSVKRIQIGPIVSRGLKLGQYRPLDAEELQALRDVAAGHERATPRRAARPDEDGAPPRRKRRPGKPDPAKTWKPPSEGPAHGGRNRQGPHRKRGPVRRGGPGGGRGPSAGRGSSGGRGPGGGRGRGKR
jgi:23S rRNA pseudouridine2605 synthase